MPGSLKTAAHLIDKRSAFCSANGAIDCGCGTGLVLAAIASRFAWGVGVDLSSEMIQAAAQKKISRCRFIAGDCFRLSELCPKAAAVFSRGVLLSHYGAEQGMALLGAMRASLVEEGFMACDFLNESARSIQIHAPENKTYYSRQAVIRMALEAGFNEATVIGAENRRTLILVAV
jgi:predicted TPR repeat methyltransferase